MPRRRVPSVASRSAIGMKALRYTQVAALSSAATAGSCGAVAALITMSLQLPAHASASGGEFADDRDWIPHLAMWIVVASTIGSVVHIRISSVSKPYLPPVTA